MYDLVSWLRCSTTRADIPRTLSESQIHLADHRIPNLAASRPSSMKPGSETTWAWRGLKILHAVSGLEKCPGQPLRV